MSIPSDFQIPVSSFGLYGGHAAINVSYDSKTSVVNYRSGGEAPGNNIAYLQRKNRYTSLWSVRFGCCLTLLLSSLILQQLVFQPTEYHKWSNTEAMY